MNKIYGLLVIGMIAGLSNQVNGQATNKIDSTGNVGIGDTNPANKLEVNGGAVRITTDLDSPLTFNNSDNSWQYMQFMRSYVRKAYMGLGSGNNFSIYKEGEGHIILGGVGNVGVGLSTPLEKLHVNGNLKAANGVYATGINNISTSKAIDISYNGTAGLLRSRDWDNASWLPMNYEASAHSFLHGNVGVGTNTPGEKFELYGGGNFLIKGAGNDAGDLIFRSSANTQLGRIWTDSGGTSVMYLSSGDTTPDLTINSSGNVGIGTTSPMSTVHVTSLSNPTLSIGTLNGNTGNSEIQFYSGISGSNNGFSVKYTKESSSDRLGFIDGGNYERLSILNGGNVGIGTTAPVSKLHIESVNVGVKSSFGGVVYEAVDAQIDIISNSSGTWGSSINFIEGNGASNTNSWSIARQTTNGAGNSSLRFNFGGSNSHENASKVTFDSNGNVGIGTTIPDQKLTVAGTVKSKEIIVEETAGADFVFEEDYDLPTLAQIETFIKVNKHLEGIASAEEMKANGVKVGEFQIQLLQKIEELTLHVIDLKKENTQLKKQESVNNGQHELIKALLKRIEKLEKKED